MDSKFEITNIKLTDIQGSEFNPRKITKSEKTKLENSIDTFGIVDPIIVNLKNNRIIGGHQRYNALKKMHPTKEYCLLKLGDIGWVFSNEELKLENEDYEKALNLALNKISGTWDYEKLNPLLQELELNENINLNLTGFEELHIDLNIDEDLFPNLSINNDDLNNLFEKENKKQKDKDKFMNHEEIGKIVYEPKQTNWKIEDLYKKPSRDYESLINQIDNEELKEMLEVRKCWFYEFNFSRIADYYAYQATPEEQKALEALGMVILDRNQLIENGFVKIIQDYLTDEEIQEMVRKSETPE